MDDDDSRIWDFITRGIKRLEHKSIKPHQTDDPADRKMSKPKRLKASGGQKFEPEMRVEIPPAALKSSELDRRTDDRLRKGKMPIDGKLDLHGMTRDEAHDRTRRFIIHAHQNGKRCLLIITGKGRLTKPGLLKQSLPEWLNAPDLNPYVLKIYPAHLKHGGSGAFYVYLRRKR